MAFSDFVSFIQKTVVGPSYIYNGNSYTGETASL